VIYNDKIIDIKCYNMTEWGLNHNVYWIGIYCNEEMIYGYLWYIRMFIMFGVHAWIKQTAKMIDRNTTETLL
jgi:hypothetical protein